MKIVPQPWMQAEVVDFIRKNLAAIPDAKVLEFGSGCSTAFFAQYTSNLVTIEHNPHWHATVKEYVLHNSLQVDLRLVPSNYYEECTKFPPDYFDFILVDGHHRMNCLRYARPIVKPGGILLLDDATYFEKYKEADNIMADWQRFDAKGFKKNPLDSNAPEKECTAAWWVKPNQ